jgi:hypothetical protein
MDNTSEEFTTDRNRWKKKKKKKEDTGKEIFRRERNNETNTVTKIKEKNERRNDIKMRRGT